jgi:hypothetical protein
MASLTDAYGDNYQSESKLSKGSYVINTIANNIAHRQLSFRLFDTADLWDSSPNLSPQVIDTLTHKIKNINKQIHLFHIDKTSKQLNMIPELVLDIPVEYFMILDAEYHRSYFIYITPREVNSY